MTKLNFKKFSYDVIVISVRSSLLRHQKHYQTNVTRFFFIFWPFLIKISGYASALLSYLQLWF